MFDGLALSWIALPVIVAEAERQGRLAPIEHRGVD
jgi:hypothetical protein